MSVAATLEPFLCATCKSEIPGNSTTCTNCKPSLSKKLAAFWDKFTGIGKLGAVFGVISTISAAGSLWLFHDSYARVTFATDDENHVILSVRNTGNRPSELLRYRLIFDDLPGKEMTLDLARSMRQTANNVIQPGTTATISLTTLLPDEVPQSLRANQYSEDDISALLARKPLSDLRVTLEIDVRESDDPGGTLWLFGILQPIDPGGRLYDFAPRQFHVRREHISADRISRFINWSVRP